VRVNGYFGPYVTYLPLPPLTPRIVKAPARASSDPHAPYPQKMQSETLNTAVGGLACSLPPRSGECLLSLSGCDRPGDHRCGRRDGVAQVIHLLGEFAYRRRRCSVVVRHDPLPCLEDERSAGVRTRRRRRSRRPTWCLVDTFGDLLATIDDRLNRPPTVSARAVPRARAHHT
jgi:hypothetical protein